MVSISRPLDFKCGALSITPLRRVSFQISVLARAAERVAQLLCGLGRLPGVQPQQFQPFPGEPVLLELKAQGRGFAFTILLCTGGFYYVLY